MNFENLYSRVFIKEAEEIQDNTPEAEISPIPVPDNYDVEPLPLPSVTRLESSKIISVSFKNF